MADAVCLDAGVLLKLYLPEPESAAAEALVGLALERGRMLVEPAFLSAEVLSVLRRRVHRGTVTPEQAAVMLDSFFSLPVETVDGREVYERAWRIAAQLDLPVLYDAVYLAVAELRGAAFWTADRVLYGKACVLPGVHLLGNQGAGF